MFDLILAAMLAQMTPAPDATPTASASTSDASPTAETAPVYRGFPDGPRRLPLQTPPMTTGDALVRNSGSTNTAGYVFVVHTDATVDVADGHGGTNRETIGKAQAKWLFAKLEAALPVSDLPGGRCMKSASFGSRTTITYKGATSPDLLCPGGPETTELNRTIGVIVNQLHIDVRGSRNVMNRL
jgi:hypothetical protein